MKSKRAESYITERSGEAYAFVESFGGTEVMDPMAARTAVEIAEHDARDRAIEAFCASLCNNYKNGECHAFIVGYNRLHEKCEIVRETIHCSFKIDNFLKHYDNE